MINNAIAARHGDPRRSDAVVLTADNPIDFSSVPATIEELIAGMILTTSTERSQFQNYLPDGLLEREERSIITSDPTLVSILQRLRSSPIAEIAAGVLVEALGVRAG